MFKISTQRGWVRRYNLNQVISDFAPHDFETEIFSAA
jgi:hypothetical protein